MKRLFGFVARVMGDYRNIHASAWNRFATRYFSIEPKLMGASHSFSFEDHKINVSLPQEDIDEIMARRGSFRPEHSRIDPMGSQKVDGKLVPTSLAVDSIDLIIEIPDRVAVHKEMLHRPPNALELLDNDRIEYLNQLGHQYSDLATNAFEYWVRVLRWKSMNGAIGRPQVRGHFSGWSTYILERKTKKRVWAAPSEFTVFMGRTVTATEWGEADLALRAGLEPPLYYDLYFDGSEQRKQGELSRAIVDFAVACEVLMRSSVAESLPTGVIDSIQEYVDDANIRPVFTKFMPDLLSESGRKAFKPLGSKLHQLFDARNRVLHSGLLSDLTDSQVAQYQQTTASLIDIKSNAHFWV